MGVTYLEGVSLKSVWPIFRAGHGTDSGKAIGLSAHRLGVASPQWGANWRAVVEPAGETIIIYLFNN